MIKSYSDYKNYLEADRIALGKKKRSFLKKIVLSDPIWEFQKCLRKYEYVLNCKNNKVLKFYFRRKLQRKSLKLGFTIPENIFGPGLAIGHYGSIVINGGTKVGKNCRIHICTNIGTEPGYSNKAPQIGDNVYIGPGAKIFGPITIANNIVIGANAVVNKDIIEENSAYAGVPSRKIGSIEIENFIKKGADCINQSKDIEKFISLPAKEFNAKLKEVIRNE